MEELVKAVKVLVSDEYRRAAAEHGGAANTPHEGYALIKEEAEEADDQMSIVGQKITALWSAVKTDDLPLQTVCLREIKLAAILGACELIQVAAMAVKAHAGVTGPQVWKGKARGVDLK